MSSIYESDQTLAQYLLFHYGLADEILPPGAAWPAGMREALDFPRRTVAHFSPGRGGRGLDLGCAVGRSALEMARACDEVLGLDYSHAFIRAAETVRTGGTICYHRLDEGHLRTELEARMPDGLRGETVRFLQGDAMNLAEELGTFDRVHAANLLCRLTEPLRLLERLPTLVKAGGELVMATPCTWLAEFTPPANWPPATTLDFLVSSLAPHFTMVRQAEEPFLLRETARKFQWTRSLVTVWRRRGEP